MASRRLYVRLHPVKIHEMEVVKDLVTEVSSTCNTEPMEIDSDEPDDGGIGKNNFRHPAQDAMNQNFEDTENNNLAERSEENEVVSSVSPHIGITGCEKENKLWEYIANAKELGVSDILMQQACVGNNGIISQDANNNSRDKDNGILIEAKNDATTPGEGALGNIDGDTQDDTSNSTCEEKMYFLDDGNMIECVSAYIEILENGATETKDLDAPHTSDQESDILETISSITQNANDNQLDEENEKMRQPSPTQNVIDEKRIITTVNPVARSSSDGNDSDNDDTFVQTWSQEMHRPEHGGETALLSSDIYSSNWCGNGRKDLDASHTPGQKSEIVESISSITQNANDNQQDEENARMRQSSPTQNIIDEKRIVTMTTSVARSSSDRDDSHNDDTSSPTCTQEMHRPEDGGDTTLQSSDSYSSNWRKNEKMDLDASHTPGQDSEILETISSMTQNANDNQRDEENATMRQSSPTQNIIDEKRVVTMTTSVARSPSDRDDSHNGDTSSPTCTQEMHRSEDDGDTALQSSDSYSSNRRENEKKDLVASHTPNPESDILETISPIAQNVKDNQRNEENTKMMQASPMQNVIDEKIDNQRNEENTKMMQASPMQNVIDEKIVPTTILVPHSLGDRDDSHKNDTSEPTCSKKLHRPEYGDETGLQSSDIYSPNCREKKAKELAELTKESIDYAVNNKTERDEDHNVRGENNGIISPLLPSGSISDVPESDSPTKRKILQKSALNHTADSQDDNFNLSDLADAELDLSGVDDPRCIEFTRVADLNDIFQISDLEITDRPAPVLNTTNDNSDECHTSNEDGDEDYEARSSDESSDFDDVADDSSNNEVAEGTDKSGDTSANLNISCVAGAIDDDKLFANPKGNTKSKRNFCYYCKTLQTVISRHLETVHKDESDVKKFAVLPKGNHERTKIIETIRLNGNFLFNSSSQYNIDGQLIVARRPKEKRSAMCYKVCHNCKGTFSSKTIRRHRQRCTGKISKHSRSNTVLSRRIAGRLHEKAGNRLKDVVFPVMREDEVVRLIRYDELLIVFANDLCSRYVKQQQHDMIRTRLRLLGRVLRTVKSMCAEITDFTSLLSQPQYYDILLKAINIEGLYNEETGEHDSPSVVTTLGTYLAKVAETLVVECIKKGDREKKERVEDFLKIHKVTYSGKINKAAQETQSKKSRQNKKPLPTMEDIMKLHSYLSAKWKVAYSRLDAQYSYDVWLELAKTTLILVLLFNRRRTGEIERIGISDLKGIEKIDETTNPTVYNALSAEDKILVQKYSRFVITGKLGRIVPVLLSSEMEAGMKLILKRRGAAKVHPQNPFVFGIPGYDKGRYKHLRSCELMRQYSNECGAANPESLRGTALRKHMATTCAATNVHENQIHDIANFMGHADDIHKRHYRQSVVTRDVCGVSKILETAMGIDRNQINDKEDTDYSSSDDDSVRPGTSTSTTHKGKKTQPLKIASTTKKQAPLGKSQNRRTRHNVLQAGPSSQSQCGENTHSDSDSEDSHSSSAVKKQVSKTKKHKLTKKKDNVVSSVTTDKKRKIRWTQEEKDLAWIAFGNMIKEGKLPNTQQILQFLKKNPCVRRTCQQMRTWASNKKKAMNTGEDW